MTRYETQQKPRQRQGHRPPSGASSLRVHASDSRYRSYRRGVQRLAARSQTHAPRVGRSLAEGTVLPSGTCEYCLAVDGRWLSDPLVKEIVANPFGGGTPFLWWPAHLKHFTPPVRDFYNQPTKTNRKTQKI